jgi:hypothetical protein
LPVLDLLSIEDNNALSFVLVPGLLFLYLLDLLACSSLSFSSDATHTDLNVPTV